MSTPQTIKKQIQELIGKANNAMGKTYTDLTSAVNALIAGYGTDEIPCSHEAFSYQYTPIGNKKHNRILVCSFCGEVLGDSVQESCVDSNGDGKCDRCGQMVVACLHEHEGYGFKYNGDNTHTMQTVCMECGEIIKETVHNCSPAAGTDSGKCLSCGHCTHKNKSTGWTKHGDGTHTTTVLCKDCGKTISQGVEDCMDSNGDGKCDVCDGDMPNVSNGADYYGELNLVSGWRFYINTKSKLLLSATANTFAIAGSGGSISGKSVWPITIPENATRITVTFGDTVITGADIMLVRATDENNVETHRVVSAELDDSRQIVAEYYAYEPAGYYNWLVINAKAGSTFIEPDLSKIKIRFD